MTPQETIPTLAAMDADESGDLSREEFEVWMSSDDPDVDAFTFLDLNGDGLIDQAEFEALSFESLE